MIPRALAHRQVLPAVGLVLGALAIGVAETWLWAGQPGGDPSSAQVHQWYADHDARVLVGDVLWGAACAVLVRALWVLAARHSPTSRRWVRALAVGAAGSLAASAVVAATIAGKASPLDDRAAWDLEGTCFELGGILLAACLLLHAGIRPAGPGTTGGGGRMRWPVAIAQVAAAVLILLPGQAVTGLATAFVALACEAVTTASMSGQRSPTRSENLVLP